MIWALVFTTLCLAPASVLSIVFGRRKSHWSMRKAVLAAAVPGPSILLLLCIFAFAASFLQPEGCTHGECDSDHASALFMVGFALAMFGIGTVIAWRIRRRMMARFHARKDLADIFE